MENNKDAFMSYVCDAIIAAYKKQEPEYQLEDLRAVFNAQTEKISIFARKQVVSEPTVSCQISLVEAQQLIPSIKIGEFLEIEVTPANFSHFVRIAIQTAKELAMDRHDRDLILKEFNARKGTCTTGLIERIEPVDNGRKNVIVYLGRVEGCLTPEEQLLNEAYTVGNRLRVFIAKLQDEQAEAKIIVSRIHPELEREQSEFLSEFQSDS